MTSAEASSAVKSLGSVEVEVVTCFCKLLVSVWGKRTPSISVHLSSSLNLWRPSIGFLWFSEVFEQFFLQQPLGEVGWASGLGPPDARSGVAM